MSVEEPDPVGDDVEDRVAEQESPEATGEEPDAHDPREDVARVPSVVRGFARAALAKVTSVDKGVLVAAGVGAGVGLLALALRARGGASVTGDVAAKALGDAVSPAGSSLSAMADAVRDVAVSSYTRANGAVVSEHFRSHPTR